MPVPGDNVSVTRSSDPSAEIIAADELAGGVKVQRVKVGFGTDGSYSDVTAASPLPVTFAGTIGAVDATLVGQTTTIDVSVLGTASVTGIVSVNNFPSVQTVDFDPSSILGVNILSGDVELDPSATNPVNVQNFPASQTIDGTVDLDPSAAVSINGEVDVNVLNDLQLDPSAYHGVVGVDFDPSDTVNVNITSPLESTVTGERVAAKLDRRLSDIFGRIRTSDMRSLFESKLVGGDDTNLWSEVVFGGAGSSHVAADSEQSMTTSSSGDAVIRQTFMRHYYEPGKSSLSYMTGLMTAQTNVRKRMGLFSTSNAANSTPQNGIYLESNSGAPDDFTFYVAKNGATAQSAGQSSWNLDTLDGNGPSGLSLDPTASLLMFIEFAWLGAGPITVGFVIGNEAVPVHIFANTGLSASWTTTPNLPFGYSIYQSGAGAGSMRHGCVMSGTEGISEPLGKLRSVNNGSTNVSANSTGTKYALKGIRLKSAFLSAFVSIESLSGLVTTADEVLLELIRNPTVAGTFTYSDITGSVCQEATGVTANTVTGGQVLWSGYMTRNSDVNIPSDAILPRLGVAVDGTRDTMVLVATPLSPSADVYGSINWREAL